MMSSESTTTQETMAGLAELHGKFLQFLRGRVGNPAVAEDILQAAYVKAIQHGAEWREAESSVAWFYRILRNAITDHYRHNTVRSTAMDRFVAGWKENYELELQAKACTCVQEVIRNLKPEYRTAIEQVDLAEISVADFARTQSTTPNNASVRLHRARKTVVKRLKAVWHMRHAQVH